MAKTGSMQFSSAQSGRNVIVTVKGIITTTGSSYQQSTNSGTYDIRNSSSSGTLLKSGSFNTSAPKESTTTLFTDTYTVSCNDYGTPTYSTIYASYNYHDWCTASGTYSVPSIAGVTRTISYNANGGSGAPSSHSYTLASSGSTNLSSTKPTRTGYTFLGWSLSSTATSASYSAGQAWSRANNSNYTLYAVWKANYAYIYYNINGGRLTNSSYGLSTYNWITYGGSLGFHTINYGASTDPYNASTFGLVRDGYTFAGWKVYSTGTVLDQNTSYASTVYASYTSASTTTANSSGIECYLHAQWTPNNYTLTVECTLGAHVGISGDLTVATTSGQPLSKTYTVTYGQSLTYWFAVSDGYILTEHSVGGTSISTGQAITVTGNMTFKVSAIRKPGCILPYLGYDVGLPDGYSALHYLESDGTQYIDTGYKPTSEKLRIVLDFEKTSVASSVSLFGSEYNPSSGSRQWSIVPHGSSAISHYVGNTSAIVATTVAANQRHLLDCQADNGTLSSILDGEISTSTYSGSLLKSLSIFLFANNIDGTAKQFTCAKYYSAKIYDNDVLVRDFVPCTDSSGTLGMYDLVNDVFYGNYGDGDTFNTYDYNTACKLGKPIRDGYTFKGWDVSSTLFDGSTYYDLGRTYMYTDMLSYNLWAYMDDWSDYTSSMRLLSCTESGGFNIEHNTEGCFNFGVYNSGVGYTDATTNVTCASLVSGWHMFSFTFDSSNAKAYIDGELVATSDTFSSGKIGYHASNTVFIGAETTGIAGKDGGAHFIGEIKKLQFANTAWDADTIAKMYSGEDDMYTTHIVLHDADVTATWERDAVDISYDANGGTGAPETQVKDIGTDLILSDVVPTRLRHTFIEWNTSVDGTGQSFQPGNTFSIDDNTVLYAIWRLDDDCIKLFRDGTIEAIHFEQVSTVVKHFGKGGYVYATEFVEHESTDILFAKDGKCYAKDFRQC